MNIYDEDPETGAPRGYRAWENPPMTEIPVGRDVDPPRGPFTMDGEADLRGYFQGMDRETAQRLIDEADDS